MGRVFTDKDTISFDGVGVGYLGDFDQLIPDTPPWQRTQRDWTWALLLLSIGLGTYVALRAIGWIVNGFIGGSATDTAAPR